MVREWASGGSPREATSRAAQGTDHRGQGIWIIDLALLGNNSLTLAGASHPWPWCSQLEQRRHRTEEIGSLLAPGPWDG